LIVWLRENIAGYKASGFKVYFNLVGGFKSLQGGLLLRRYGQHAVNENP